MGAVGSGGVQRVSEEVSVHNVSADVPHLLIHSANADEPCSSQILEQSVGAQTLVSTYFLQASRVYIFVGSQQLYSLG